MDFYKHSELASTYHVSLKTVHNWIDAAKNGKLDLKLQDRKGRKYVARTPSNVATLEKLSQKGKKFRNVRYHKVIHPRPEFYDLFTRRQALDLINNLKIHKEIPRQYNYFDKGADYWDEWVNYLEQQSGRNALNITTDLLSDNLETIYGLLDGAKQINVIDLGVGNAKPIRPLLDMMMQKGILHRYIAVDISHRMLDIAGANLRKWYGDELNFELRQRDISFERFDDLIVEDVLNDSENQVLNLICLFGSTSLNFRDPSGVLRTTYNSMGVRDILLYNCRADTKAARHYFDFSVTDNPGPISPKYKNMLDLLSIEPGLYQVENGFDEHRHMRYLSIRFTTSVTLEFIFKRSKKSVNFEKGESVLLWRVWHPTAVDTIVEFEDVGFQLLHSTLTRDREAMMTIHGIDAKSDIIQQKAS